MPNPLDTDPATHLVPFVQLNWGATFQHVARYARWDEDVTDGLGNVWSAAPEMDMAGKLELQGGAADKPLTFQCYKTRSPIDQLTAPFPFAQVNVITYEGDPHNMAATLRPMHAGFVSKTSKNQAGFAKLAQVQVSGWRELMQYELGIRANTTCAWTLFDPLTCGLVAATFRQAGTISAISGSTVTVTGLTDSWASYFQFGSINVDGLQLGIINEPVAASQLQLIMAPPPQWAGASCSVLPGCDKRYSGGCGPGKWNNQDFFGGFGIAMLAYHPQVESPT